MHHAAPQALDRMLSRPELLGLAGTVAFRLAPVAGPTLLDIAPGQVTVDPALFARPTDAALVLAFAGELALWRRLGGQGEPAALAAALSTLRLGESLPPRAGLTALPDWLATLQERAADGGVPGPLGAMAAPTAWLMLQNCDPRLDLDPVSRRNRYGCGALPMDNAVAFDSCTAASTSRLGWQAAEALRRRLIGAALGGDLDQGLCAAGRQLAGQLAEAAGVAGKALPVLAASGTTAALLALHLCRRGRAEPDQVLILGAPETGSGTPLAVGGRHSAPRAPSGAAVTLGLPVGDAPPPAVTDIAIRDGDGRPIDAAALTADLEQRIARAIADRRRVVLHAVDGSKTGLTAPGIAAIEDLRRRFGDDLAVIVDACQMRLSPAMLERYAEAGCLITVTGSKFLGGPPFSGGLLVPPAMMAAAPPLPPGLAAYSWRGDWPDGYDALTAALPAGGSPGLYLRWQAALADWAAFAAVRPDLATAALRAFADAVIAETAGRAWLRLLPGPRSAGIFTLGVAHPERAGWLDDGALRRLHAMLGVDAGALLPAGEQRLARCLCHVGQPVSIAGWGAGLRLAAGARQIVALGDDSRAWRERVALVLEKLELLLRAL